MLELLTTLEEAVELMLAVLRQQRMRRLSSLKNNLIQVLKDQFRELASYISQYWNFFKWLIG